MPVHGMDAAGFGITDIDHSQVGEFAFATVADHDRNQVMAASCDSQTRLVTGIQKIANHEYNIPPATGAVQVSECH